MRKIKFLAMALVIGAATVTVSCEKDDAKKKETSNSNDALDKAWRLGDKTYNSVYCTFSNIGYATILAARTVVNYTDASKVEQIQVVFKTKPTANGSYKIVYKPNYMTLNTDEVHVIVNDGNGKNGVSKGDDNKTATVKLVGGKVNVIIPKINANFGVATTFDSTTTIEANITEQ